MPAACSNPQAVLAPYASPGTQASALPRRAPAAALVAGLPRVRAQLSGALRNAPLLVGPSRKKFLGRLTGAQQRPPGFAHAPSLFRRSDMSCWIDRMQTSMVLQEQNRGAACDRTA